MTIALTGAGSFGVRAGHLIGGATDVNSLRGGTATTRVTSSANLAARVINTIEPDFANGTSIIQIIATLPNTLSSFQTQLGAWVKNASTEVQQCLQAMAAIDTEAVNSSAPASVLTSALTASEAVTILVNQMVLNSTSVQQATVAAGAQTAVGTPNGTPSIVVSVKNKQGFTGQLIFPETISFVCTGDSQSGSTLSNEPFLVTGQTAVSDELSQLWPAGSGASKSISSVDGSKSNSTGNLLQNSNFTVVTTPNVPDNFTIGIGAAGVDIFQTTATTYLTGGASLEFTGTGSALLDGVTQSFGVTPTTTLGAGGTSAKLLPSTTYHFNCWIKLSSASPATGVLAIALVDGSAYPGTILTDGATNNNLVSVALTGIGDTNWHIFSGSFHTPAVLPTTTPVAKLRISLTTHIESGKSVFISDLSLTAATQLYNGGPFVSIHSGATAVIAGINPDTWTVATTNNYGTSGSGLFQQWMERIFGLRALGIQLPYSGSPTISDSLIA